MKQLSTLFSSSTLKHLQRGNLDKVHALEHKIKKKPDTITYGDLFNDAFDTLIENQFRNEYIFKTELINHYKTPKSLVLTEFRIHKSVADIIIIDNTYHALCFEIKSDHDSLNRLSHQLHNYQKMFPNVVLFADSEKCKILEHNKSYDHFLEHVGIECFHNDNLINTIKPYQESYRHIDKETICACLRVQELKMILESLGVAYKDVPNTQRYAYFMKLICENSDERILVQATIEALYRNRYDAAYEAFIYELPRSLRALALTTYIQKKHQQSILNALKADING